jgi:protein SCO1/2
VTVALRAAPAPATLRARVIAGLVALLATHGGATLAAGNDADAAALRTSQAAIGQVTGDRAFTGQDGRPLRLAELRGRPVVLSLVYTNCYSICSGATLHLREVVRMAREALGARSFAVLTVGFDTAHDTPERMRSYGRDRGIVDPDWHFASADAATVRGLADDVGFTWVATPGGFDHVAQVTVLDADGKVAQQVYGPEFAPPELVEPLRRLLLGRSIERPSVQSLIERVKLYCSVYDPASGRYRFDYSVFAAAIPALMVLGMLAAAIVIAGRRNR